MDKFYTPDHIAASIINYVTVKFPDTIADFTAGAGDLLTAAAFFWPRAKVIANDYDKNTVYLLKKKYPSWSVSKCNFLQKSSRDSSRVLKPVKNSVSLILLNPPFSCRGGTKINVIVDNHKLKCSTSMAFILYSTEYLAEKGEILAILPRGTILNEKDRDAWVYLKERFTISIINNYPRDTFIGCFPHTILVRIKHLTIGKQKDDQVNFFGNETYSTNLFKIIRGTQQIHKLKNTYSDPAPKLLPFLHTTRMSGVASPICWMSNISGARSFQPPAVLIPRVGEPKKSKICVYTDDSPAILSDCIFAIECQDIDSAVFLSEFILLRWDEFYKLYGGTCAKFLTVNNLQRVVLNAQTAMEQYDVLAERKYGL